METEPVVAEEKEEPAVLSVSHSSLYGWYPHCFPYCSENVIFLVYGCDDGSQLF